MVGTSRPARSVAHALRNAGAQGRARSPSSRGYTVSEFPKGTPPGALPPSRPRSLLLACGGTFFSPYRALRFPVKLHRRFGLIPPARPGLSAPVFYLLPISSKFAPSVSLNSQLFLRSHKPIKMLTMQCQQGCPAR